MGGGVGGRTASSAARAAPPCAELPAAPPRPSRTVAGESRLGMLGRLGICRGAWLGLEGQGFKTGLGFRSGFGFGFGSGSGFGFGFGFGLGLGRLAQRVAE